MTSGTIRILVVLVLATLSLLNPSTTTTNNSNNTRMMMMMFVNSFSIPLTHHRHAVALRVAKRSYYYCYNSSGSASLSKSSLAFSSFSLSSTSTTTSFGATVPMASMSASATTRMTSPRRMLSNDQPSSSNSNDDVSIVETCRRKIAEALATQDVKVIGAYDDPNGSHISIEVTSALFEGKRPVQRQQLVYKALWEELQGPVHAVDSMICKTPDEKK